MEFPYGEIVSEIPKAFTPPEMWPEYGHIADPVPICKREIVQENPVALRWSLWPLTFEQYFGDKEPDPAKTNGGELAYNRIVLWRPLRSVRQPHGWHRGSRSIFRVDGYQLLDENFTVRWNKNARRDVRLWQDNFLNKTYVIEEISLEEYADAYKKSLIARRENCDRLHDLERKLAFPIVKNHTVLLGVRNMESGKIIAGTAVIFSPLCKSSTHFAPFILEEARHTFASTGLIHHWFEESLRRGMPVVMTTNFWHKGKPKGWKGFSEFKSHFGFTYVTYPPVLWRFVRGKFW